VMGMFLADSLAIKLPTVATKTFAMGLLQATTPTRTGAAAIPATFGVSVSGTTAMVSALILAFSLARTFDDGWFLTHSASPGARLLTSDLFVSVLECTTVIGAPPLLRHVSARWKDSAAPF